ncbi:MAG: hypothetical protein ACYSSN_05260, partial [Planctomycetota bacterium]
KAGFPHSTHVPCQWFPNSVGAIAFVGVWNASMRNGRKTRNTTAIMTIGARSVGSQACTARRNDALRTCMITKHGMTTAATSFAIPKIKAGAGSLGDTRYETILSAICRMKTRIAANATRRIVTS